MSQCQLGSSLYDIVDGHDDWAGYHLHSESKFENGDTLDKGLTRRRHIQAVANEYAGKEANRWEDQFFLGEIPEAQIEYWVSPAGKRQLLRLIGLAARKFGQTALANAARVSRKQLRFVIGGLVGSRPITIRPILQAIMALEAERQAESSQLSWGECPTIFRDLIRRSGRKSAALRRTGRSASGRVNAAIAAYLAASERNDPPTFYPCFYPYLFLDRCGRLRTALD